jgi:hypothetical protein
VTSKSTRSIFSHLPCWGREGEIKEAGEMKKIFFLAWATLFIPALLCAQEKIEAPAWNVADKWVFSGGGTVEVLKSEPKGFVVKFSEAVCVIEGQGFESIVFDKASLHRVQTLKGEKRNKYTMGLKKIFDFPYTTGKQWKRAYCGRPIVGPGKGQISLDYYEKFKILGWEEITVQAGKFRALKIEVIRGHEAMPQRWISANEYKGLYWYSPDVKYFVKCEYDPASVKNYGKEVFNWELISFYLKK